MFRTLEDLPTQGDDGKAIRWIPQSFAMVRAELEKLHEKANRIDHGSGADFASVWYLPPGATPDQAIGCEAETELIKTPHTAGTYFVRFRFSSAERPVYVQCTATPEAKPNPLAGQAADERRILMQSALLDTTQRQLDRALEENARLRGERNELTDLVAELRRQIAGLSGALEAAEEDRAPMFDDAGMDKILDLIRVWTEGGEEARAQGLIAMFLAHSTQFAAALYEMPEVLSIIVRTRPEAYDAFARALNDVANDVARVTKQPPRLLYSSSELVPRLAEHARSAQRKATRAAAGATANGAKAPARAPRGARA